MSSEHAYGSVVSSVLHESRLVTVVVDTSSSSALSSESHSHLLDDGVE
jgi:hypothetical protein